MESSPLIGFLCMLFIKREERLAGKYFVAWGQREWWRRERVREVENNKEVESF